MAPPYRQRVTRADGRTINVGATAGAPFLLLRRVLLRPHGSRLCGGPGGDLQGRMAQAKAAQRGAS